MELGRLNYHMKITNIQPVGGENIEVEGFEYTDFRRFGPDSWEVAMGESWESWTDCTELEKAYQEAKK